MRDEIEGVTRTCNVGRSGEIDCRWLRPCHFPLTTSHRNAQTPSPKPFHAGLIDATGRWRLRMHRESRIMKMQAALSVQAAIGPRSVRLTDTYKARGPPGFFFRLLTEDASRRGWHGPSELNPDGS